MQGRRFQDQHLLPPLDNIHRIRRGNPVIVEAESEEILDEERAKEEIEEQSRRVVMDAQRAVTRPRVFQDYARLVITSTASCLVLGEAARNYDLKTCYINQLPSFHGLASEDPVHFLREYYATVQTFPLHGLNEDQLRMRCFPYTLKDRAKV